MPISFGQLTWSNPTPLSWALWSNIQHLIVVVPTSKAATNFSSPISSGNTISCPRVVFSDPGDIFSNRLVNWCQLKIIWSRPRFSFKKYFFSHFFLLKIAKPISSKFYLTFPHRIIYLFLKNKSSHMISVNSISIPSKIDWNAETAHCCCYFLGMTTAVCK